MNLFFVFVVATLQIPAGLSVPANLYMGTTTTTSTTIMATTTSTTTTTTSTMPEPTTTTMVSCPGAMVLNSRGECVKPINGKEVPSGRNGDGCGLWALY